MKTASRFLMAVSVWLCLAATASAEEFSDPSMVLIPEGEFVMGSGKAEDEPPHAVHLSAFYIDRHEVTQMQFEAVMDDNPSNFESPNHPVEQVTWYEARDYCLQVGKRLPTEAEWEKAARGVDGRFYPWGNDPDPTRANARGMKDGHRYPAPVGTFPKGASPYGALDMAGNVWEWTADWYRPYPGNLVKNDLYGNTFRVMRGGSWFSNMDLARSTVRGKLTPDQRQNYIGFRCAR